MQIQLIERGDGLPREEVVGRLANGWICVPNVAVPSSGLIMPGRKELGGAVDVWLPPPFGAMMPQLAVVQALAAVANKGGDIVTLDALSKLWFNRSLRALIESLQQNEPSPTEGEADEEQG